MKSPGADQWQEEVFTWLGEDITRMSKDDEVLGGPQLVAGASREPSTADLAAALGRADGLDAADFVEGERLIKAVEAGLCALSDSAVEALFEALRRSFGQAEWCGDLGQFEFLSIGGRRWVVMTEDQLDQISDGMPS